MKYTKFFKSPNIWDCARGESSSVELWETWSKLWQQLKPQSKKSETEENLENLEYKENLEYLENLEKLGGNSDSNWNPFSPLPKKSKTEKEQIFLDCFMVIVKRETILMMWSY